MNSIVICKYVSCTTNQVQQCAGVMPAAEFWVLVRANKAATAAAAAAGSLADRYGGKFVLTTGVFLWSLFTVLTPGAAAAGTVPLLAARVLLGIGEGVAFPSIHSMIGKFIIKTRASLCTDMSSSSISLMLGTCAACMVEVTCSPLKHCSAGQLQLRIDALPYTFACQQNCTRFFAAVDSDAVLLPAAVLSHSSYIALCLPLSSTQQILALTAFSPAASSVLQTCAARNVPVSKRSTAVGIITAASYAGTALAFGLSPLMISRFGWQWVFYLFGGSALLWLPFWLPLNVLKQLPEDTTAGSSGSGSAAVSALQQQQQQGMGKDSPLSQSALGGEEDAPLLQRQSFEIIPPSSTTAVAAADGSSSSTGFQALLRRREVWAICVCQYAQSYGMYGLLTWLPTFFTDFYGVKLVDLGGYTLLPYVLQVGGLLTFVVRCFSDVR
jgi:MFS family permease